MQPQHFRIEPGDTVTQYSPGGGGYGLPREREVDLVLRDVREGLVTIPHALREYGVRVDPRILKVLEIGAPAVSAART